MALSRLRCSDRLLGTFATFARHEACTKAPFRLVLIVSPAQLPHVLGRRSAAQRKWLPVIPLELVTRAAALAIGTLEATGITVARTHLTLHFSRHSWAF